MSTRPNAIPPGAPSLQAPASVLSPRPRESGWLCLGSGGETRWAWLFFGVFLGVVYALNCTFEFCSDDCYYGCVQRAGAVFEGVRPQIGSLGELWREMLADGYRPVVHVFARLFTGVLGKGAFNVANSAMAGMLVVMLNRLAFGRWWLEARQVPWVTALVFGVLCKGESYLWCAGSCNYLWAGVFTLGFYGFWERLERQRVRPMAWGLALPAVFLCGWVQEGFSLPVCFGLGVYTLFRLRRLTVAKVATGVAYGAGAVALAWVSARRLSTVPPPTVAETMMTLLKIAVAAKGVWVLGALLLVGRGRRQFIRAHALPLLIVLGSLLMIACVGFNGERSLWCANLFAILLALKRWQVSRPVAVGLGAAQGVLWVACLWLGVRIHGNFVAFREQFLRSPDGVACHERVACGPLARFFHQSLYRWQPGGHGRYFAEYYARGYDPVGLSGELYRELYQEGRFCRAENRLPVPGEFYTTPSADAIVMPIAPEDGRTLSGCRVRVTYAWPAGVGARVQRELAKRRTPMVSPADRGFRLRTAHGDFLLIPKEPGGDAFIRAVEVFP